MQALLDFLDSLTLISQEDALQLRVARLLEHSAPAERAWCVRLMLGQHSFRRHIKLATLQAWAQEHTQTPDWLYKLSHDSVRDHAETCALLPSNEEPSDKPLDDWLGVRLAELEGLDAEPLRARIVAAWAEQDYRQRFLWNRWVTSTFRISVPEALVLAALAEFTGLSRATLAHRLADAWFDPTRGDDAEAAWSALTSSDNSDADLSRPYPFAPAEPLDAPVTDLGDDPSGWIVEWQWRGARAQLIRRASQTFLWTRDRQLVTQRVPEVASIGDALPDGTVLDGELLVWQGGPLPVEALHDRLARDTPQKRHLTEAPVVMMAFDLLEYEGADVRDQPQRWRRDRLRALLDAARGAGRVGASPALSAEDWDGLQQAITQCRQRRVSGLVLKPHDQPYGQGWRVWPTEPLRVPAVVLYVRKPKDQPHAHRPTDCTLGVWSYGKLVPVTQASLADLPEDDLDAVLAYAKDNTTEKFGPARAIKPGVVVELEFDAVYPSPRHRVGLQLRGPRVLRWLKGAALDEIEHLKTLRQWMA